MKKYMMKGMAAIALLIAAAGCSHESDYTPPTQEEALNNATEKLGVDIDPYQDWNMTAIWQNTRVLKISSGHYVIMPVSDTA